MGILLGMGGGISPVTFLIFTINVDIVGMFMLKSPVCVNQYWQQFSNKYKLENSKFLHIIGLKDLLQKNIFYY